MEKKLMCRNRNTIIMILILACASASFTIQPNPLISRGKPVYASSGNAANATDGNYGDDGQWTPDSLPAWVAINIGKGYTRVAFSWLISHANFNEQIYGGVGDYKIQVSNNSTNGSNGTWTDVAAVTGNEVRCREHSFDFTNQSWVRMYITAPPSASIQGVSVHEMEVYDFSQGNEDTWFFMGNSITNAGYVRGSRDFASDVHAAHTSYFPFMINGGISGETSQGGVDHVADWLQLNPDFKYWCLEYGTNDSWNGGDPHNSFIANMQTVITAIKAAGRVPVLARIPYAVGSAHTDIPAFNAAIDSLVKADSLMSGPDLYAWFMAHPEELSDSVHPNSTGASSMCRLWAEAMDPLYESAVRQSFDVAKKKSSGAPCRYVAAVQGMMEQKSSMFPDMAGLLRYDILGRLVNDKTSFSRSIAPQVIIMVFPDTQ